MLPTDCQWIAVGDWNMVEEARDKLTGGGRILGGQEQVDFELFKSHLHIMDFLNYNQTLKFSWDNKRKEGRRVLARLDRVYLYPYSQGPLDNHI